MIWAKFRTGRNQSDDRRAISHSTTNSAFQFWAEFWIGQQLTQRYEELFSSRVPNRPTTNLALREAISKLSFDPAIIKVMKDKQLSVSRSNFRAKFRTGHDWSDEGQATQRYEERFPSWVLNRPWPKWWTTSNSKFRGTINKTSRYLYLIASARSDKKCLGFGQAQSTNALVFIPNCFG